MNRVDLEAQYRAKEQERLIGGHAVVNLNSSSKPFVWAAGMRQHFMILKKRVVHRTNDEPTAEQIHERLTRSTSRSLMVDSKGRHDQTLSVESPPLLNTLVYPPPAQEPEESGGGSSNEEDS